MAIRSLQVTVFSGWWIDGSLSDYFQKVNRKLFRFGRAMKEGSRLTWGFPCPRPSCMCPLLTVPWRPGTPVPLVSSEHLAYMCTSTCIVTWRGQGALSGKSDLGDWILQFITESPEPGFQHRAGTLELLVNRLILITINFFLTKYMCITESLRYIAGIGTTL